MRALFVIVAFVAAGNAFAQLLTEKKFFTLPQYTTVGGKPIKSVRVGYETYGKLNAAGDNAVFVPHFFSGTSHAAGRYKADDKAAGYWDAIIGPGKAIDTDKYFVVSADTLVNLNVKSPASAPPGPRPSIRIPESPTARHSPSFRCATSFACTRRSSIRSASGS